MLHACQATYMWAHYKWPTQQPYNIWALQIHHIKNSSQQPLNIMCYMHAGQHICSPTASVPADRWVIYMGYTHATIRTDMAWDTSDICLLQACHPAISPPPYRSCLKPCYYSWHFLPNPHQPQCDPYHY